MKTIDIKNIIESSGIDFMEYAELLFPKIKLQRLALNRAIKSNPPLKSDQISKLSLLSGVPISAMYSDKDLSCFFKNDDIRIETPGNIIYVDLLSAEYRIFSRTDLSHDKKALPDNMDVGSFLNEIY